MEPERTSPEALLAHTGFLHRLAEKLVFGDEDADDYVQETLAYAIERPPAPETHLKPWLVAALRNFLRQDRRSRLRRRDREARAARPETDDADRALRRERARIRVVNAVFRLPEPYRTAVVLRYLDGLPPREIAKRTGAPTETVRTRLKRALVRLREDLDRGSGDDRRAWCVALLPLLAKPRIPVLAALAAGVAAVKGKLTVVAAVLVLLATSVALLTGPGRESGPPAGPGAETALASGTTGGTAGRTDGVPGETPREGEAAVADRHSVRGTVRDADGNPVPGAVLFASPADVPGTSRWSGEGSATSDGAGRFTLDLPLTCPVYAVVATAPGRSPAVVGIVRPGAELDLVLAPTASVSGRVRDLEGRPVAGARVRWVWRLARVALVREAVTATDGTWRIDDLPDAATIHGAGNPGRSYFGVDAGGFAPVTLLWSEAGWAPGDPRADFWLGRGATVVGRVTDAETGEALGELRVLLVLSERPELDPVPGAQGLARVDGEGRVDREIAADGNGEFTFEHLPARAFHAPGVLAAQEIGRIVALSPGRAAGTGSIRVPAEGNRVRIDVELWPGAAVVGRVIDESGRPVANAWVGSASNERQGGKTVPVPGPWSAFARTDADGRYRLDAVPASSGSPSPARVAASAYLPDGRRGRGSVDVTVQGARETAAHDLVLAAMSRTEGDSRPAVVVEVRGPDGAPVWAAGLGRSVLSNEVRTGPDGRGRMAFEEGVGEAVVFVRAPGFAPAVTPPALPDAENPPVVTVTLAPGRRIAGRLEYDDGTPAAEAGVVYALPAGVEPERVFDDRGRVKTPDDAAALPPIPVLAVRAADGQGRFVVDDLPDEAVTVIGQARGLEGFAVAEGVAPGTSDLVLTLPGAPPLHEGLLECVVRDAKTGSPVPRFSVELFDRDSDSSRVRRRDERPGPGLWRTALPPGRYRVRIVERGWLTEEREVEVAADGKPTTLKIELSRGGAVVGRVLLPERPDTRGASIAFVKLEAEGRVTQWNTLEPDGRYRVEGLAPGRYRVELYLKTQLAGGPGIAPRRAIAVEVPPAGGEVSLDFEAVPAARLCVQRGGSPDGTASPRARVVVRDHEGRVASEWPDLGAGTSLWLVVPPGTLTVTLEIPGRERRERTVTVKGGRTARVEFE